MSDLQTPDPKLIGPIRLLQKDIHDGKIRDMEHKVTSWHLKYSRIEAESSIT